MKPSVFIVTALGCAAGCTDAWLVGGDCLPGYKLEEGACVLELDTPGSGGGDVGGSGGSSSIPTGGGDEGGAGGGELVCEPLVRCINECVDPKTDARHCGGCGNVCASGICEEGLCVGDPAGHVVAIGIEMGAGTGSGNAMQILGNAVLLHPADPVRVVTFRLPHIPVLSGLEDQLEHELAGRGRTMQLTRKQPYQLIDHIQNGHADVFLITSETLRTAGMDQALADELEPVLTTFVGKGGVVVAIAGTAKQGDMQLLLDGAGLIPGVSMHDGGPGPYAVTDWSDALSVGVVSPFMMGGNTARGFSLPAETDAAVIVSGADDAPVVIHRALAPSLD